jgi:hypothetical protein
LHQDIQRRGKNFAAAPGFASGSGIALDAQQMIAEAP